MLTIGGVSYDAWLKRESLEHENTLGAEPDSLSFALNPDAPKPSIGAEVVYTLPDGSRLFGGVLVACPEAPVGHKAMGYQCSCSDWRTRADRRVMNDRYINKTAGEIIVAAFAKYAPEFDTSMVDLGGQVIASIRFKRDSRLTTLLDRLAGLTGWVWDIDPYKQVIWQPPGALTAPIELRDGSRNFHQLTAEPNRDELRNRVIVQGGMRPSTTSQTDTWTGDGLTGNFRIIQTPYSSDQYLLFEEKFSGLDLSKWVETDTANPSPYAGHIPADGYLFTTIQQGAVLSESGKLQVAGGTGTWGQVRLMSYAVHGRGDGFRRFEWDVYPGSTITGQGRVGLWDPNNQGALAGEAWGFLLDAGTIKPSVGGVAQTALATVTYTANDEFRVRIVPGASGGAVLYVNKDKANGYRSTQWVKLYDAGSTGALPNLTIAAIWNSNWIGRIDRIRVQNRLMGLSLTVAGIAKTLGLVGVDEDGGVDALLSLTENQPLIKFFTDSRPTSGQAVALTYYPGIPVRVVCQDNASVAALAALEGNDGVYEGVVDDKALNTTALAQARGQQELEQYANPVVNLSFTTLEPGLRAGQVLTAALTQAESGRDLQGQYLIQSVLTRSLGSDEYEHTISAGSRLKGLSDYLLDLLRRGRSMDDLNDDESEPIDELLFAADEMELTESWLVQGPQVVAADSISFSDAWSIASGPLPPYLYDTAQYGLATYA